MALIKAVPEGRERLRAELGVRLMEARVGQALHGLASLERLRISERACELSEQLGDASALLRGLVAAAFVYSNRRETQRGQEIASRCLAIAEQNQNREMLPYVQYLVAWCAYACGDPLEASSQLNDLMKHLVSPRQGAVVAFVRDPWVLTPSMYALVQHALGRPDEALKLSNEALRRRRQLKHPFTLALALTHAAILHGERREPEAVRALAEAEIALAEEHGLREFIAEGRSFSGWAMAELGEPERGVAELEANAASVRAGLPMPVSGMLAQAYMRLGRADRAVGTLEEALAAGQRWGVHHPDAELHRLMGEAILLRDPSRTDEAETCFRKAIQIAGGHSAKWWELRATVSLGRLLTSTGQSEAREMLREIYGWFTEGFDTRDLKDAKAVLDELTG